MKITIHIEDATLEVLSLLGDINSKSKPSIVYPHSNSNALILPVGNVKLKKDGTPAKKRGRPVGSTKKAKV